MTNERLIALLRGYRMDGTGQAETGRLAADTIEQQAREIEHLGSALGFAQHRDQDQLREIERLRAALPTPSPATVLPPDDHARRVIVVGHGRVGQLICAMLEEHRVPYLATDRDAALVERFRAQTPVLSQSEIHPRARLKTIGGI